MENQQNLAANKSYEIRLRLLGNEVFAINLSATSDSNRWVAIGLITVFCTLTILGAYGEKIVGLFSRFI